jgi:cytochrome oxidase Cu insertion factor (SCO1/SenC/PrrC family)
MPGMNSGLDPSNPIVVAAFRAALLHQGIAALVVFGVLSLAWVAARDWRRTEAAAAAAGPAEPAWRRLLRIGFGLLWLFDGLLQAQPAMAVGLPSQVIEPAAQTSPHWIQHLVNWGGTTWSYHPVETGAAAVWIQVGIGLWLLFAARGPLSRLAGPVSVAWGLVVWAFGEAFGGIFAPGLSWLTGAPGGVLYYCVAGALIALPARLWLSPRLGRLLLGGTGVFLAGMAVLQAWPGRGFWQGSLHGQPGSLTSMVQDMAGTSQPAALAALVTHFGSVVTAHGFAVNLVAVAALGVLGAALTAAAVSGPGAWLARRPGLALRATVIALGVLCVADWVLVQDFGFFGGLGTDPNSMLPVLLVAVAGYLALTRAAEPVPAPQPARPAPRPPAAWRSRLRPAALPGAVGAVGAASVRTVLSASAIGVILLGAVPMAAAQASPAASAILAESIDGNSAPLNSPAPGFALTDQNGHPVSLASLRGKAVLLAFLDPVCITDCPLEAQEFRQAGEQLGAKAKNVELVAVNLNPLYNSTAYTRAFDREEQLAGVPNWLFLTGSPAQLQAVWKHYGIESQNLPAGSMLGHSDAAFVIGPDGHLRQELNFDPGPGTAATESSFATELAVAARQAIAS